MNKAIANRIGRLEGKVGADDGMGRYIAAIRNIYGGLPPNPTPPIPPEKQKEIDDAFDQLSEEGLAKLKELNDPCEN